MLLCKPANVVRKHFSHVMEKYYQNLIKAKRKKKEQISFFEQWKKKCFALVFQKYIQSFGWLSVFILLLTFQSLYSTENSN